MFLFKSTQETMYNFTTPDMKGINNNIHLAGDLDAADSNGCTYCTEKNGINVQSLLPCALFFCGRKWPL